jgi:hypothetical protein
MLAGNAQKNRLCAMQLLPHFPAHRCAALLATLGFALSVLPASAAELVGVYDSRVIAYACFGGPGHQATFTALMQEGRAAKDRGDAARFKEIDRKMKAEQKSIHLQVFSTAPCPDALATLSDRVETVRRETGITRLVSKWDKDALKHVPAAERIDVTESLVHDLPLTEKQRTVMREIAAKEPLPLWKAKALAAIGRL